MEIEKNQPQSFFQKRRLMVMKMNQNRRQQIFERTRKLFHEKQQQPMESQSDQENSSSQQVEELNHKFSQMANQKTQMVQESPKLKKHEKWAKKQQRKKLKFAKKFQVPDWLNTIPKDFHEFFVTAKPDSKKVIVEFIGNHALARDKQGSVIHQIQLKNKQFENTILQGYMNEKQKVLFISDLISWKGNTMSANEFMFRYSWLKSNLIIQRLQANVKIVILEYYDNKIESLRHLYEDNFGYDKDGFIFIHKDSFYEHGHNPSVLRWKDQKISKYPLNQAQNQPKSPEVKVVGKLRKDNAIYTEDNIKFIQLDPSLVKNKRGYVKFAFQKMNIEETNNQKIVVHCENVQILSFCSNYRSYADPLSKILYQYKARYSPIKIENIVSSIKFSN